MVWLLKDIIATEGALVEFTNECNYDLSFKFFIGCKHLHLAGLDGTS